MITFLECFFFNGRTYYFVSFTLEDKKECLLYYATKSLDILQKAMLKLKVHMCEAIHTRHMSYKKLYVRKGFQASKNVM